jgi:predicted nucleotidyltransferase
MVKDKNVFGKKNKGNDKEIKLSPKERIITSLLEHKDPISILALSGSAVLDYKNTYNIVNDLQPEIISKEKIGNTNLIKLNLVPNQEIYSVESKRTEEFLSKHPQLRIVKRYTEELNYPFLILLVFGSYIKGTRTESSDIDLCIISDNKNEANELQEKLSLLSLKLEIHEFTTKEFISMIEKKQNNLGHEIVKNNLLLYGIENYYNLISKWMKKE